MADWGAFFALPGQRRQASAEDVTLFTQELGWMVAAGVLGGGLGHLLMGSGLLVGGVMVAVAWGKRGDETHAWEQTRGPLAIGVGLGLLSALCQSLGTLMIKPLMVTGVDPVAAAAREDQLDDVGGYYPDIRKLEGATTAFRRDLSYRSLELPGTNDYFPTAGTPRHHHPIGRSGFLASVAVTNRAQLERGLLCDELLERGPDAAPDAGAPLLLPKVLALLGLPALP